MSDGYNSMISQGGSNLSGGQKQRIAIARALAKKPDIYIFDDSFSALDFKTEAKLRNKLLVETKNKIVLIIAQRVTTVMNADQIVVLDEGQISGIGKHHDLMKTCAVYKEIVVSQR
jgi:ATP-binding cassette subfamily B protein